MVYFAFKWEEVLGKAKKQGDVTRDENEKNRREEKRVGSKRTSLAPTPALLGPGPFLCSYSNVFFKYLATAASLLIRGGKESKHNYRQRGNPWSQDERATQNGLCLKGVILV